MVKKAICDNNAGYVIIDGMISIGILYLIMQHSIYMIGHYFALWFRFYAVFAEDRAG